MRMEAETLPKIQPGCCDFCGAPAKFPKKYCSPGCRTAYNNLLAAQGKAVMQALKLWRKHRGRKNTPGQDMISFVARRVDAMLEADRDRKTQLEESRKMGWAE